MMKKTILSVVTLVFLSGCGMDSSSYLVRWWNGDIIRELSPEEKKISDICYKETEHLPRNNYEEREKASLEHIRCLNEKEKEFGIK